MKNQPQNITDNESKEGMAGITDAINNAEDFKDPLEDLVERCKKDPGVVFKPEVIEELATLKKEDLSKFESLRAELRKAGCSMKELNAAIKEINGDDGHKQTQADIIIKCIEGEGIQLFHTEDKEAYVDVDNGERRETYNVHSKEFQNWLRGRFFKETNSAPTPSSLQIALGTIEAKAIFEGEKREVFLRIGNLNGRIYIDLGGDDWQAVEIDRESWRIIQKPPVRFRRPTGIQEIPAPKKGGLINDLKEFLNLENDEDFVMVVAWLLAGFRGQGPYPVMVLSGEQGAAKTSCAKFLRSLLDPNKSSSRALPRNERDLFIAANNGYVLSYDNVSRLPYWLSDSLCRLSSGGGFATRQLLTDRDEVLFEATRPIILNGIESIVRRSDLADRALFFTLKSIPEELRCSEIDLWKKFEEKRPYIFGVLLDALVEGLKRIGDVELQSLPRMADFAKFGVACEGALWKEGTFCNAYAYNRDKVVDSIIASDPVASAILSIMEGKTEWKGTATDLLKAIEEVVGPRVIKSKNFPKGLSALSGRLTRVATFLRKKDIEIERKPEGRAGIRMIYITRKIGENNGKI